MTTDTTEECMDGVKTGRAQVRDAREMRPCPAAGCAELMRWDSVCCGQCWLRLPARLRLRLLTAAHRDAYVTEGRAMLRLLGAETDDVPAAKLPTEEIGQGWGWAGRYPGTEELLGVTLIAYMQGRVPRKPGMLELLIKHAEARAAEQPEQTRKPGKPKAPEAPKPQAAAPAPAPAAAVWECIMCGGPCAQGALICAGCRGK